MKNFKIIHQTKHGTGYRLLSATNLHEALKLLYKKAGSYTNIIKIYERSGHGDWVDMEISWK